MSSAQTTKPDLNGLIEGRSTSIISPAVIATATLESVGAFLLFLCLTLLLYGITILQNPSTMYVGTGHDSAMIIWSLAWWPYAMAHGLNPFIARVIWAPAGFNLAWATATPGPALLLWPITYFFGPVVSFNLMMILTPALMAQSVFLLCRHISGRFFGAVLGGYIFAFSPYMLGHLLLGQTSLTLICGVPLCLYILLLRLDRSISATWFVLGLTALLSFQFLVSTEIVALMTLFGAFSFALALVILPREKRLNLVGTLPLIGLSYLGLVILLSPYLYYAFALGIPEQMHPVAKCSADLVGYFVPSSMMWLGGARFAQFDKILTPHMWYGGKGLYTNPALLVMLLLYGQRHWREAACKVLILSGAFIVVCSLGPELHIFDQPILQFPWHWIMRIPTLNQALPIRFAMYYFLLVAIAASIVTNELQIARPIRVTLAVLAIILMLPNHRYITTVPQKVDTPAFFNDSTLRTHVAPGDTLLIFPFSIQGTSMIWQAQAQFYFKTIGGYISTWVPLEFQQSPVISMMLADQPGPDFAAQLKPFLSTYNVKGIVIAPESQARWREAVDAMGIKPENVGDVLYYRVGS